MQPRRALASSCVLWARRDRARSCGCAVGRGRDGRPAVLADTPPPVWRRNWNARRGSSSVLGSRVDVHACGSTSCRCCSARSSGCRSRSGWRPRRVLVPLRRCVLLFGVFVAEGAAGRVGDRPLPDGRGDLVLLFCAVAIGGWSMLEPGTPLRRVWMLARRALVLYGTVAAATTLSLIEPAHDARLPRGLPQGARRARCTSPAVRAPVAPLPAAVAAQQQADPRRALDPRHGRPARHRRAQPGARRRRQGLARAASTGLAGAAWPSTRSAAPCSSRRSSTSATIRATRSRWPDYRRDLHEPLLRGL